MPYIKTKDRDRLAERRNVGILTSGELNYVLTEQLREYIRNHGLSYQTINDVVGALEGAKLEFYRRVAAPYEDKKIEDNGDVY